jgi:hypothetical protein
MRKTVIFASALLLAIGLLACSGAPKFSEFKSEAGKFTVMAPAVLLEETQTLETQAGKIDLHVFSTQSDDIGYFVSYCDYPQEIVQRGNPETMLDGSRDGALSNAKGTLVSETKITLEGHPGRELLMEAKDESGRSATIKGRLFMVKNRLYQVMVVAPKARESGDVMDRFIKSFKLLGQ